jgi:hypothetical protein
MFKNFPATSMFDAVGAGGGCEMSVQFQSIVASIAGRLSENVEAGAACRCRCAFNAPAGLAKPKVTRPASEPACASSPPSVALNASLPSLFGSLTVPTKWAASESEESVLSRLTPRMPMEAFTALIAAGFGKLALASMARLGVDPLATM